MKNSHWKIDWFCLSVFIQIALCGCMVGPDYENANECAGKEIVEIPTFTNEPNEWKEASPKNNAPKSDWWKIFNDKLLDDLMLRCKNNNPDLKSAFYRVEQARESACMTKSRLFPWIGGNADFLRFGQSENGILPYMGTFDNWITGATLTWDIDLFGRVRSMLASERANAEQLQDEYENMILVLQSYTAQTYFSLSQLLSEREVLKRSVKVREEETSFIRSRVEMKFSPDIDLQRAIQQEKSVVIKAVREVEDALANTKSISIKYREQKAATEAAKKVEAYAQQQYNAGLTDYFSTSEAHRYALANELACVRYDGARYKIVVELIKSLGGSWKLDLPK